jgi:hypothetical protein
METKQTLQVQPTNKFDPSSLRLSQNFSEYAGVKKLLTSIPVRKPLKQDFVRVCPDPAFRLETMVLEVKEDNETYLVVQDLWSELQNELVPKVLFLAINRQNVLFLWPVRLPTPDGRHDSWNTSALEAAKLAEEDWVRVASNMHLQAYEVSQSVGLIAEPVWPSIDLEKILEIAFKGRRIEDLDHPILRRLRGEV